MNYVGVDITRSIAWPASRTRGATLSGENAFRATVSKKFRLCLRGRNGCGGG